MKRTVTVLLVLALAGCGGSTSKAAAGCSTALPLVNRVQAGLKTMTATKPLPQDASDAVAQLVKVGDDSGNDAMVRADVKAYTKGTVGLQAAAIAPAGSDVSGAFSNWTKAHDALSSECHWK